MRFLSPSSTSTPPARKIVCEVRRVETIYLKFKLVKYPQFKILQCDIIHEYIIRMYTFTQRIANDRNILPRSAVMSTTSTNLRVTLTSKPYLRNRAEDYTSRQLLDYLVEEDSK